MNRLFIASLLVAASAHLSSPTTAEANCSPCVDMREFEASVWPPPGPTPVGTVFVLQQMNSSATGPIAELDTRNPRLETDAGETIALRVAEHFEGECAMAAVTLIPDSAPLVGQTYFMRYDAPDGTEAVPLVVGQSDLHAGWVITLDQPPPPGPVQSIQLDTESIAMGCGPSNHITIGSALDSSAPANAAIFVERTPTSQFATSGFLLFPDANGAISLGHSMCQGAFLLGATAEFDVTLTAIDAVGQSGPPETLRLTWP